MAKLEIGHVVYHADVYDFGEALEIVGIRKDQLELKGDYSGLGHNVDTDWLPIAGKVSRVYKHAEKEKFRKRAQELLDKYVKESSEKTKLPVMSAAFDGIRTNEIIELANAIIKLTRDVELNKIYETCEK